MQQSTARKWTPLPPRVLRELGWQVDPDGLGLPFKPFSPTAGRHSDALCRAGAAGALSLVRENLRELNTSYLDVVLLHWPCGLCQGERRPPAQARSGVSA